jgi:tetratricopeptide (TPR) repeat protein
MVKVALFRAPNVQLLRSESLRKAVNALNIGAVRMQGETALQVARKGGADITVRGRLEPKQKGFIVHLAGIRASNGETLVSTKEAAEDQRAIATAVAQACVTLISQLTGGDLSSMQAASVNVEPADTLRPDALERFTAGLEHYQYGEMKTALEYLQEATRIDRDFAMAYVYEAIVHGTLRQQQSAFETASRAYSLSHRVNDRQRQQVEERYFNYCGDYRAALERQRVLLSMYPNEAPLHRQAAQTYAMLDLLPDAIRHAEKALELDPRSANNYMILASALAQVGRFGEAEEVLRRGFRQAPGAPTLLSSAGTVKIIKGDVDGALSSLRELEQVPEYSAHARSHQIRCLLIYGRLDEARVRLQADELMNKVNGDAAHEDISRYWLGHLHVLDGNRALAAEQAKRLAERLAEPYNLFSLRAAAEVAFESGSSEILQNASKSLEKIQEKYQSTRSTAFFLQSQGMYASLVRRQTESQQLFAKAYSLWPDIGNSWTLAQSLYAAGSFAEALPHYEDVIAKKGTAIRWEQQIQWVRSLPQAARCYKALGRQEDAVRSYNRFLDHWGGQAHLALVRQVVAEKSSRPI